MLSEREKELCKQIARESIAEKLGLISEITPCPIDTESQSESDSIGSSEVIASSLATGNTFHKSFGLFVSLHKKGQLRGCIGYILPYKPLYQSLIELSRAAAFGDNRFKPVSKDEFEDLEIEISILSPLSEIQDKEEIKIGRDGLYIKHPRGSGLLLPQVATKYNWDSLEFLIQTCYKAGLPENCLSDPKTKIFRFEAEIF